MKKYDIPYEEYLSMLEETEWIDWTLFSMFYNNNPVKKTRISAAINKGTINFKVNYLCNPPVVNKLAYSIYTIGKPVEVIEHTDYDDKREAIINRYLTVFEAYTHMRFYIESDSFQLWLKKNYPPKKNERIFSNENIEEKSGEIAKLCLADILKLITPEMYPDGLKSQGKSAITNSLKTLQGQIPKAFELCSALVMEAMPCKEREEYLQYFRDDIITRAKEKGINRPTALQIYQGLPAMLKK